MNRKLYVDKEMSNFPWCEEISYLTYNQAKEFLAPFRLRGVKAWLDFCKSGKRPKNIPAAARSVYGKTKEWDSWADFLGYGSKKPEFWSFDKAREYVRGLGIKSINDWYKYTKSGDKPAEIPADPRCVYTRSGEWKSYGDFLGNGIVHWSKIGYMSYDEACAFVAKLDIKSVKEWKAYCKSGKKPDNIPSAPWCTYGRTGEWKRWGIFLGFEVHLEKWRSYEEAHKFAKSLGLRNTSEWNAYNKSDAMPQDIPRCPDIVYRKEWKDWGTFLGTENKHPQKRVFMTYEEAQQFMKDHGITSVPSWEQYCKKHGRPSNIPRSLCSHYKSIGKWKSSGEFFGTGFVCSKYRKYMSYEEAKIIIHPLRLNQKSWKRLCAEGKAPTGIPACPNQVYGRSGEWVSWGDFCGSGEISNAKKQFVSYEEARVYAVSMGIKTSSDWVRFRKSHQRPHNIPASPSVVYRDKGWISWKNFLQAGIS